MRATKGAIPAVRAVLRTRCAASVARSQLPSVEESARLLGDHALPKVAELAVTAVLEASIEVAVDELVVAPLQSEPSEMVVRTCSHRLEALREGE